MTAWLSMAVWAQEPAPPADPADPYAPVLEAWLHENGAPDAEIPELVQQFLAADRAVTWKTGAVALHGDAVALDLGSADRYCGAADADKVLQLWGNPPNPDTLGLLFPDGAHVIGPGSPVVITSQEDGWVDDAEAASIDYDALLEEMKQATKEEAAERRKQGLDGLELVGWAEPPHYDAASHVLYWAKLLRGDDGQVTLNYDVRVLGREGVLSLNALADADDLEQVKVAMERVRSLAKFTDGHRYADYQPGVDQKAAYGIAALIAGGAVAAKTGLLKGLLAFLIAGKKAILAGLVALAGVVRAFWGRLTGAKPEPGPDRR